MKFARLLLSTILITAVAYVATPAQAQQTCTPPDIAYIGTGAYNAADEGAETLFVKDFRNGGQIAQFNAVQQSFGNQTVYGGENVSVTGEFSSTGVLTSTVLPAGTIACFTLLDQNLSGDSADRVQILDDDGNVLVDVQPDGNLAKTVTIQIDSPTSLRIRTFGNCEPHCGTVGHSETVVIAPPAPTATSTSTPTNTSTPSPTMTNTAQPTSTATPTVPATVEPTSTPQPSPDVTNTPQPSATSAPTSTPQPTPKPTDVVCNPPTVTVETNGATCGASGNLEQSPRGAPSHAPGVWYEFVASVNDTQSCQTVCDHITVNGERHACGTVRVQMPESCELEVTAVFVSGPTALDVVEEITERAWLPVVTK